MLLRCAGKHQRCLRSPSDRNRVPDRITIAVIGLPPTVGLVGKVYLFRAVIDGGFYGLAVIGVLTSLISAYYYLRVVVVMYMRDGEPETERESFLDLTTIGTAVATVVISLVPQFLFAWASSAVVLLTPR